MSGLINITIEGAEEKAARFQAAGLNLGTAIANGLQEGMLPITETMRSYAPPRGNYARTGNYGARISTPMIEYSGGEVTGYITSTAPYNVYVAGMPEGGGQAWMHAGRWEPLISILARLVPAVYGIIDKAIERMFGGLGLL
jgi:hypothetical protein